MTDALFRVLLWLLPSWFRSEFAPEMRATFQADLADARRAGMSATGMVWMRTVRDVSRLALRLHAETLAQDVAYAVRTLRRTPTFTLAAIVTLVVGLAPTVVVANLIHQVVVAPLPFPQADRLVALWNANPERGRREVPLSLADFVDYHERQRTFAAMAAHTGTSIALSGAGEPQQIGGVLATSGLDEVLGVRPRLGRLLEPADSAVGAVPVVVLGARLWRTQFGERMNVVGEQVVLDGTSTTIAGVLPDGLDFPSGSDQAWLPLRIDPSQFSRGGHFLSATGRVLPGTPVQRAAEDLNTIARSPKRAIRRRTPARASSSST